MTVFTEWWNNLLFGQQLFLLIALPSSVLLVIQTIMLLVGFGDDSDGDDIEEPLDDGLTLFAVRGIVSMLCITGWSGFALLETKLHVAVSITIAVLLGLGTLVGMAFLMRAFQRLQSSGNIVVSNTIGKVGQVYIPIPPNASAAGKVNVTVQDKFSEFSAITMDSETIPTGTYVRVVAVDEAGTLVVERASSGRV